MEWIGWITLVILLCYSAYPGKVRKLESKVKRLERKQGGVDSMSKLMNELVGKSCKIKIADALGLSGSKEIRCMVLDADDEWIKFTYEDKKNITKTKILRIDSIENIELYNK